MKILRTILLTGLGVCALLRAESPVPAKIQVTNTEKGDFPTGGKLRLPNAIGELTIEGWDQPGIEMTTIKATKVAVEAKDREAANKLLESVKIATERKGDEVIISTAFPTHHKLARIFVGMTDFDLEYRIKVPRSARLEIDQTMGEVHIDDITGEIKATEHLGEITVRVPEGMYAIDAKSKLGAVDSDFPGTERGAKWWFVKWPGQAFTSSAPAAPQKMFLRAEFGDIVILKRH